MFLAYEGLRETTTRQMLAGRTQFAEHGLVRLFFPEDFATSPGDAPIDAATWATGVGASVLEALQPRLHRRWLELERSKNQIGDWSRMRGIGVSQRHALEALFAACDDAKRPDLARFILKAMGELLTPDQTTAFWIGGLQQASASGATGGSPGDAALWLGRLESVGAPGCLDPSGAGHRLPGRRLRGRPALVGRLGALSRRRVGGDRPAVAAATRTVANASAERAGR